MYSSNGIWFYNQILLPNNPIQYKSYQNKVYLPFNNKLKSNVIQINFSSLIDEFLLSI